MIFGHPKPVSDKCLVEHDAELGEDKRPSPAIFSRAVPSPASPGAMLAIVLLTDNNQFAIADQIMTVGVMTCALAIAYLFLLLAEPIIWLIWNSGAVIISRVMGMILASVAADTLLTASMEIVRPGAL